MFIYVLFAYFIAGKIIKQHGKINTKVPQEKELHVSFNFSSYN